MKLLLESWREYLNESTRQIKFVAHVRDKGTEWSDIDATTRENEDFERCADIFGWADIDKDTVTDLGLDCEDDYYSEQECAKCLSILNSPEKVKAYNAWYKKSIDGEFAPVDSGKMMLRADMLKAIFKQVADYDFLKTVITTHWTNDPMNFLKYANKTIQSEIPATATLPGQYRQSGWPGGFGIVLEGTITLLAKNMDQIKSNLGRNADQQNTKRGVIYLPSAEELEENFPFVLDKEGWGEDHEHQRDGWMWNEAFVDNSTIKAIVMLRDAQIQTEKERMYIGDVKRKAEGMNIPVYDIGEAKVKL